MGTVCRARRRNELIEPGGSDARFPACVDSGGIVRLGIASTRTGWARGHAKARKYGCDCDASSDVGLGSQTATPVASATPPEGHLCAVHVKTGLRIQLTRLVSESKWDTDSWQRRPPADILPAPTVPAGGLGGWSTKGGLFRGCANSVRYDWAEVGGAGSLPTFKAITAGQSHTCAIRTDDTVACWGPTASVSRTPLRAPSRRSARAPSTPAPSGRMTPSPAGEITGTPRHLGVNREHSEPDAVQAVPAPGRRSLSDSGAEARVKRPHVLQACTFPRATPTAPAA